MPEPRDVPISSRREPQQARSADLVAAVLEAAVQVLEREGPRGFTAARVAERAGVSVGSLYQYFPGKAAILFRLQSDEWRRTAGAMRAILEDASLPPPERLRTLARAFLRSERAEAAVRAALAESAPRYREAPEGRAARAGGGDALRAFLAEAAPEASEAERSAAAEVIAATLSALGKRFSAAPLAPEAYEARAEAVVDMLGAYLESLGRGAPQPTRTPSTAASRSVGRR